MNRRFEGPLPGILAIALTGHLASACAATKPATQGAAQPGAAAASDVDWVARVNGVPILAATYHATYDRALPRAPDAAAWERMTRRFVDKLVETELVDQALEAQQVTVSPEAVTKEVEAYTARWDDEEKLAAMLARRDKTMADLRADMERGLRIEALMALDHDIAVTEDAVRAHYDARRAFYAGGTFLRASHILVKVPAEASAEVEEAALEKLRGLQARLAQGEVFRELAGAHSDDPSVGVHPFGRGMMVAPFEEAAFALDVGAVSDPVRTPEGYHLIKVYQREERPRRSFEEVRESIGRSLKRRKTTPAHHAMIAALRDAATIEERLPSRAAVPPAPP